VVGQQALTPAGGSVLHCQQCGLPFLRIEAGMVEVVSRHHGRTHINRVTVGQLIEMLRRAGAVEAKAEAVRRPE